MGSTIWLQLCGTWAVKRGAREQTIISNITCGVADLWWAGISSVK